MLRLVRVRPCDGMCCKESPRWPTEDGSTCRYLHNGKCWIMAGLMDVPDAPSPVFPDRDPKDVFEETCRQFPQNTIPRVGKTAGCCMQWVENGD